MSAEINFDADHVPETCALRTSLGASISSRQPFILTCLDEEQMALTLFLILMAVLVLPCVFMRF